MRRTRVRTSTCSRPGEDEDDDSQLRLVDSVGDLDLLQADVVDDGEDDPGSTLAASLSLARGFFSGCSLGGEWKRRGGGDGGGEEEGRKG